MYYYFFIIFRFKNFIIDILLIVKHCQLNPVLLNMCITIRKMMFTPQDSIFLRSLTFNNIIYLSIHYFILYNKIMFLLIILYT